MEEDIDEVEMTENRGDTVVTPTEISEEEPTAIIATRKLVRQKLAAVPGEPLQLRPITIFRVPYWFHETDKISYKPKVVSIGPYHHGKNELRAMEDYKWSVLRDFLARNNEVDFNTYLREITSLEAEARLCYSEPVNMTSDEFVMMLTLDGCFILEYFLKLEYRQLDTILSCTGWILLGIPPDMLLLENQIPFFIIHKLFAIHGGCNQDCNSHCTLLKLSLNFLNSKVSKQKFQTPLAPCDQIQHLLHFYHECMVAELRIEIAEQSQHNDLVHNTSRSRGGQLFCGLKYLLLRQSKKAKREDDTEEEATRTTVEEVEPVNIIPCVSELCEAGVTFKKKKEPRHMFDISFNKGVMEIPLMEIDCFKKVIFTNVVAFEQSQLHGVLLIFTSYLALMDALINTEKDVAILEKCGILENFLQNEADAAAFYNHFADFNGIDYGDHHFVGLFRKVKKYSDSTWHNYRAILIHDYFGNPWTIISVVAGVFLLILTVVQTYYTVISAIHQ